MEFFWCGVAKKEMGQGLGKQRPRTENDVTSKE
jgi:hypothetical protein